MWKRFSPRYGGSRRSSRKPQTCCEVSMYSPYSWGEESVWSVWACGEKRMPSKPVLFCGCTNFEMCFMTGAKTKRARFLVRGILRVPSSFRFTARSAVVGYCTEWCGTFSAGSFLLVVFFGVLWGLLFLLVVATGLRSGPFLLCTIV